MKIRRKRNSGSRLVRPVVRRLDEVEGTLEVVVTNLDTWLEQQITELASIRQDLEATKVQLEKIIEQLSGGAS